MKKCALLLFGISYSEYDCRKNLKYTINYNNSFDNYQKHIYKYFHDKGYLIDVYFSTNISNKEEQDKLIEKYKPLEYSFIENEDNRTLSRNRKFINVIKLCLNKNIIYDNILITRFDLLFQKDFEKSNIKLDKFNLVSILERDNLICDNFYILPFSKLKQFYEIAKKNISNSFHKIKNEIEKIENPEFINYILDERVHIHKLSFYKICRNNML